MVSTSTRTLDLWRSNSNTIFTAVQNDKGARFIEAKITSGGYDFVIPSGSQVTLAVKKPDETETLTEGTYEGAIVTVELTNQTLAAEGLCEAQIQIVNGESRLATPPFKISAYGQVVSDDTVTSTDEYSALVDALDKVNGFTVDTEMSDESENAVQNKVAKAYVDSSAEAVEAKIPTVDIEVSDESENPVENKVIKAYVDDFEKWRTIQAVTSTEEVELFKFTTDSDGNAFALKKLVIFGRLYFDYPDETEDNMLLRVKSDDGYRYLAFQVFQKSKVEDGTIAFTIKALYDANTGITYSEYLMSGSSTMQGIGTNRQYSGLEMSYPVTRAIKDVQIYIHYKNSGDTDYSYLPLKAGSQITILGVDE